MMSEISKPFSPASPPTPPRNVIESDKEDETEIPCLQCTFLNHPLATSCVMCDFDFPSKLSNSQEMIPLSPVSSVEGEKDDDWVFKPTRVPISATAKQSTLKRKYIDPRPKPAIHDLTHVKYGLCCIYYCYFLQ